MSHREQAGLVPLTSLPLFFVTAPSGPQMNRLEAWGDSRPLALSLVFTQLKQVPGAFQSCLVRFQTLARDEKGLRSGHHHLPGHCSTGPRAAANTGLQLTHNRET